MEDILLLQAGPWTLWQLRRQAQISSYSFEQAQRSEGYVMIAISSCSWSGKAVPLAPCREMICFYLLGTL